MFKASLGRQGSGPNVPHCTRPFINNRIIVALIIVPTVPPKRTPRTSRSIRSSWTYRTTRNNGKVQPNRLEPGDRSSAKSPIKGSARGVCAKWYESATSHRSPRATIRRGRIYQRSSQMRRVREKEHSRHVGDKAGRQNRVRLPTRMAG